ncbi:hypothetical protein OHB26_13830 [Nocardia sp. NBC_01503]|uniref:hypothetical protein n=1 Tax=Nocardia sp. NBC_01503 TaxID=2975997 RepID=UPI002E7BF3AA|nr:hypothetical protein [Nocardia sp. NBC_01503]WTL35176.1 hypothetical protein OHB26_13830 [Nocardia sp. NBC_01503]
MIFDSGPFVLLVPMPRFHAGWFAGTFIAVIGFAVIVMLVVAGGCGRTVSTEPGPVDASQTVIAGNCSPFCGTSTSVPVELPKG